MEIVNNKDHYGYQIKGHPTRSNLIVESSVYLVLFKSYDCFSMIICHDEQLQCIQNTIRY